MVIPSNTTTFANSQQQQQSIVPSESIISKDNTNSKKDDDAAADEEEFDEKSPIKVEKTTINNQTSSGKYSIVNNDEYKHLLVQSINNLSTRIQKDNNLTFETGSKGNFVILRLENDAIDYIEKIILDLFNSILVEASGGSHFNKFNKTPENACDLAMTSVPAASSSNSPSNNKTNNRIYLCPLSDLNSIINRIKQVLPRTYAEEVCAKVQNIIEKCQQLFNQKKKAKLLKAFLSLPMSNHSIKLNQQLNSELNQFFTFPIDRLHAILCSIYGEKIDIYITLYLISTLEHCAKDILYLSTSYVRYLAKYCISKRDVYTALHADYKLIQLVHLNSNLDEYENGIENEEQEEDDDDDENDNMDDFSLNEEAEIDLLIGNPSDSFSINSLPLIATGLSKKLSQNGSGSNEECSDSSTICAESTSAEHLNLKYFLKVKELILEHNQHLTDLNILRRIFMYLFQKFATQSNKNELIESIFGNINDVYECALKLADLLDDSVTSQQQQLSQNPTQQPPSQLQQQFIMIGQQFWDLAEGQEFEVYLKYAFCVTNYTKVVSSLRQLLGESNLHRKLNETSIGLAYISKYLLPKLLIGSVHHFFYIYETVEYLYQMGIEEEDKILLQNTLDTLKGTKFNLNKLAFVNSKQRPIETSFRIFQPNQMQLLNGGYNREIMKLETNSRNLNNTVSLGQKSLSSTNSSGSLNREPALAYNICKLTETKWAELEANVESFKLPQSIYQQTNRTPASENVKKLSNTAAIRYAYLFEGEIQVVKSAQHMPVTSTTNLLHQSKFKKSKRYVYLFDGLLIFVKKQQSNAVLLNTSMTSKSIFKFKQAITLDKCYLIDLDDDCQFELKVYSNIGSGGGSGFINSSQEHEYVVFICNSPNEKNKWMSMLCYSQYKFTIDRLLQTMTEKHNRNNPLPIPPPGYLFDQVDSPETILFEQAQFNRKNAAKISDEQASICSSPSSVSLVTLTGCSDNLSIKAATLVKLVERLTHHLYSHPKFSTTFLMFFREFCSPKELLELLSLRYDVPDLDFEKIDQTKYDFNSGGITERELLKRYRREYQQPIRLKVINFLKHWIEGYFGEDFSNDENDTLLSSLHEFIGKIGLTNKRFEQVLNKVLQKKANLYKQQQEKCQIAKQSQDNYEQIEDDFTNLKIIFKSTYSSSSSSSSRSSSVSNTADINQLTVSSVTSSVSATAPVVGNDQSQLLTASTTSDASDLFDVVAYDPSYPPFETHLENNYPYDILTIHPLEFARQATLMEEEIFKEIKPSELISLGWSDKTAKKYKLSPNVTKLINLSNKFTYWYAKCIIDTPNLEERVAVVQRLLEIADYFYQMNNFSGIKEIYAAFESSSVVRMQITKEKADLEQNKVYARFKQLFDNHDKGYLDKFAKCSPPCLPFIGTHLTIIVRKHEHNKLNNDNLKNQIVQEQQKQMTQLNAANGTDEPVNDRKTVNLINFSKYRLLIEFVNDLLQYQNVSYKFRINERIRSFILDDIENYFEEAKRSVKSTPEDTGGKQSRHNNLSQIIEQWLFEKSKKIEPNDCNGDAAVLKYPRVRAYALKSPPPPQPLQLQPYTSSSGHVLSSTVTKLNKQLSLSERSQSATRIDQQKPSKLSYLNNPFATASASMSSKINHKLPTASSAFPNIPKLTLVDAEKSQKTSLASEFKTSISPLGKINSTKNEFNFMETEATLKTATTINNKPASINLPTINLANNSNIIPFSLSSSTSSSPSPPFLLQKSAADTSSAILYSAFYDSNIKAEKVGLQKLSLSSADSSSSAPNSPPPNYDEVFDSSGAVAPVTASSFLSSQSGSGGKSISPCFENQAYQRNKTNSYSSASSFATGPPQAARLISSNKTKSQQNSVFAFPEIVDQQLHFTNSSSNISSEVGGAGANVKLSLPPPPLHKPIPPPPSPPLISRNLKPILTPNSVVMPSSTQQKQSQLPPCIPPRTTKK